MLILGDIRILLQSWTSAMLPHCLATSQHWQQQRWLEDLSPCHIGAHAASGKPAFLLLPLSEMCPGAGRSLPPGAHRQRCSEPPQCHHRRWQCPWAACVCGMSLWSSPIQASQRLQPLPAAMLELFTAGKGGRLGGVATNFQIIKHLKLYEKHLAWKIRQSRRNSAYHQHNSAEFFFLEIIISDSSSKNKGQKLEEARKHSCGSESWWNEH